MDSLVDKLKIAEAFIKEQHSIINDLYNQIAKMSKDHEIAMAIRLNKIHKLKKTIDRWRKGNGCEECINFK